METVASETLIGGNKVENTVVYWFLGNKLKSKVIC